MKRARVHGKRMMLNPPGFHSTAAIVAEVEDTSGWKRGCGANGEPLDLERMYEFEPQYVMLQISDCDRRANLSIIFQTAGDRHDALYKVDALIETLTEFRKGLVVEQELYVERVKRAIAEAKKK